MVKMVEIVDVFAGIKFLLFNFIGLAVMVLVHKPVVLVVVCTFAENLYYY